MSYPPQEPSLISLFCGFFKSRKKTHIYILIWSVGQLGLSKIRIVRILDPVQKNANLSRWGTDIPWHGCCDWKLAAKTHSQFEASKRFWLDSYPTTNWAVYYAWNVRTWHTLFFPTAGFWVNLGLVVGYFKAFATDGGIYNSISIRVYVKKHTLKNH